MKILLVQLGSNGDCLFVTTIAKQIKEIDYPGCKLTWMIGSNCSHIIENNHFIDEKIIIPIKDINDLWYKRNHINDTIQEETINYNFDKIFITDFTKENSKLRFGTTRSTLYRCYNHKITISPEPLVFLNKQEIENVYNFCYKNLIIKDGNNILFECSPQSGQSNISLEKAIKISELVLSNKNDLKIILSSNIKFTHSNKNIIDASVLSIRENAELVNYCNLMIGCSSGLTWLATSNWSKKIPMIQLISPHFKNGIIPASVKTDFEYLGLPLNSIIELYDPNDKLISECIISVYQYGFNFSRKLFDQYSFKMFKNNRLLFESKISFFKKIYIFILINIFNKKYNLKKLISFFKYILKLKK
jgi:ADP-heptose:LPS heptosyltransferase